MAGDTEAAKGGIGEPVRRREDDRLLTGAGAYSDDVNVAGQAYAVMLGAPHAHARLTAIETEAARNSPGVLAVLTGRDYLDDGLPGMPSRPNPGDIPLVNADGSDFFVTPLFPIVTDKVRHVGEIVAVVVAETPHQARDAAERVAADYAVLGAVVDARAALEPGALAVWDEVPGNVAVDARRGDNDATEAAFARAEHVTTLEAHINRVAGVPMEPRAAVAEYDRESGRLTLHAGNQNPVMQKAHLSQIFGIDEEKVRVVARDVGGSYGIRNLLFPEFVLVAWAARRLGRAVKWTGTRGEVYFSDYQARELSSRVELALTKAGRILAVRSDHVGNVGSETLQFVPLTRGISVTTGVYDIPAASVRMRAVHTNCIPSTTYRGAGRPEHIFLIERAIDTAARELGLDRIEMRRRNLIAPGDIPYETPVGTVYDSGDFSRGMDLALDLADVAGFPARRDAARASGVYLGLGICNYIETATGMIPERVEIGIEPEGRVEIVAGTMDSGQGHATAYAQMVVHLLGVPFAAVDLHEGDTARVVNGSGSHSSRSMRLMSLLMSRAAEEIVDQGKRVAAHLLQADVAEVAFADGAFSVAGTERSVDLFEVSREAASDALPAGLPTRLYSAQDNTAPLPNFPNGCHVCEAAVDAETGAVAIQRYAAVDDVGRVINPLLVDGQTHGGIAQGAGQALMERCAYDPETGQALSATFLDYSMPRADDFPTFRTAHHEVLAPNNPFGIKGGGEGGTTGALAAVVNAVVDALEPLGVRHIDMPLTAEKVWRAMRGAGRG